MNHAETGKAFPGLQLDARQVGGADVLPELRMVDAEKDRGNAAFSSGSHAEAVRHYQMVYSDSLTTIQIFLLWRVLTWLQLETSSSAGRTSALDFSGLA